MISIESLSQSLQRLEVKVSALERKVGEDQFKGDGPCVRETLLLSESNINREINKNDNLKALMDRMKELECYLDPTYPESFLDDRTKVQLILQSEPELRQTIDLVIKLNELTNMTNDEIFQKIPANMNNLSQLTANALQIREECEKFRVQMNNLMEKYVDLVSYLKHKICHVDLILSELEMEEEEKRKQN